MREYGSYYLKIMNEQGLSVEDLEKPQPIKKLELKSNKRKCISCGEIKKHHAKGYCSRCYDIYRHSKVGFVICNKCGRKKKYYLDGKCKKCYHEELPKIICIVCGKEKTHEAKGKCNSCYRFERYHTKRLCEICKELKKNYTKDRCYSCYQRYGSQSMSVKKEQEQ